MERKLDEGFASGILVIKGKERLVFNTWFRR